MIKFKVGDSITMYQSAAMRTAKDFGDSKMNLIHSALGLTSDAGEFATAIKAYAVYNKDLDRENAIEELGDCLWFIALACKTLNVSMIEVMQANINKLAKRYPDKYTDEAAIARADKSEIIGTKGDVVIVDEIEEEEEIKDTRYEHQKEMDACGDVVKFISPHYIDASNARYSQGPYKLDAVIAYTQYEVLTIINKAYNKDTWDKWYTQGTKVPT